MSASLEKIAKGTAITFAGMLVFIFFEFLSRVIIARYTSQSEYGAFSIVLALVNLFVFLSSLGLQVSVTRCIPLLMGRGEKEKVAGIIYSSLQLSITASMFIFLFAYFSSGIFTDIFHLEQSKIIELFAISIPFYTIIEMLSSIFIGFGRVDKGVYFRDIFMSLLKISGIVLSVILGFGFRGIIYSYIISTIASAVLFAIYAVKKLSLGKIKKNAMNRKKLLYFSFPLLLTFLSTVIITRTDTLMLGYFKTPDVVGLYNAAYPIAQINIIFLNSIGFIYISISSHLYSKNQVGELRRNYIVLTKWVLAATLPFFFIIFLFPETILYIFFGSSYIGAGDTLRILALGFLIYVFTGPNAATLIVTGKTKLNMIDDLIGVTVNVLLNLFLIPTMGIIGAAIASAISLTTIAILKSIQIFNIHKLHPFTKNYLKPIIASTAFVSIIYLVVNPSQSAWILILLFVLFIIVYIVSLIITRSLDEEDIIMFLGVGNRIGFDTSNLKKTLKRII